MKKQAKQRREIRCFRFLLELDKTNVKTRGEEISRI